MCHFALRIFPVPVSVYFFTLHTAFFLLQFTSVWGLFQVHPVCLPLFQGFQGKPRQLHVPLARYRARMYAFH
ncbi:hypothetical protein B0H17DRAFT_1111514, partial [Mycena rosella]